MLVIYGCNLLIKVIIMYFMPVTTPPSNVRVATAKSKLNCRTSRSFLYYKYVLLSARIKDQDSNFSIIKMFK